MTTIKRFWTYTRRILLEHWVGIFDAKVRLKNRKDFMKIGPPVKIPKGRSSKDASRHS
jgi:hypothetical protein